MTPIEVARGLLGAMREGDERAWDAFVDLARGCVAREPDSVSAMTWITLAASQGIDCCAACAAGEECSGD
jgi:hypothetical protein